MKNLKYIIALLIILFYQSEIIAQKPDLELGKRYLKLGNSYREAGEFTKAADFLNKGRNILRTSNTWDSRYWTAVAYEYLAYLYRDMNMLDAAKDELQKSLEIYSKLITQADGSPMAVSYIIKTLDNFSRTGTSDLPLTGWDAGKFEQAIAFLDAKKYRDAILALDEIIAQDPDNALAFYLRGLAKNKNGDIIGAEADFNMAYMLNNTFIPPSGITNPIIYDSFEMAMEEPERVQFLNLESQGFTSFPIDRLRNFPNLVSLNLRYNAINNIPSQISELKNLQVLIMDANPLTANSIPNEIENLKKLRQLSLRYIYLDPNDVVKLCQKLPEETKIIF